MGTIKVQCPEARCRFNVDGICQCRIVILAQDYGADEGKDLSCASYEAKGD